jgi:predicted permease
MDGFWFDLRTALRSLRRAPRFTASTILSLALGTGAALAIFSALYATLIQAPPFPHSNRIFQLGPASGGASNNLGLVSRVLTRELASVTSEIEVLGFIEQTKRLSWDAEGTTRLMDSRGIDEGMQIILGMRPLLGAGFTREHFLNGQGVLISHGFWERSMNGDPRVVGKRIRLRRGSNEWIEPIVIGVLRPDQYIPFSPRLDLILPLQKQSESNRYHFTAKALVRLCPSISPKVALQQLNINNKFQIQNMPKMADKLDLRLLPIRDVISSSADQTFFLVCIMAILLFAIACTNVACLFLARSADRSWELSLRVGLGASIFKLFRLMLTEGLIVALGGGLLGFALAAMIGQWLEAWLPNGKLMPGLKSAWAHPPMTVSVLILVLFLSALFASVPMLRFWWANLGIELQNSRRTQSGRSRTRSALMVIQISLASVLLWSGCLLVRSLWTILHEDIGFQTRHRIVVSLEPLTQEYSDPRNAPRPDNLLRTLRSFPGVYGAGMAASGVLNGFGKVDLRLAGDSPYQNRGLITVDSISYGYLEAMGVTLLEGRFPMATDWGQNICLIDQVTAKKWWPTGAIGHYVLENGPCEIVGIVRGYSPVPEEKAGPMLITNRAQFFPCLYLNTSIPLQDLQAIIKNAVATDYPVARVVDLKSLESLRWAASEKRIQAVNLLMCFAIISIGIAFMGLSGMLWDNIIALRKELSIRSALGAMPRQIAWHIFIIGMKPTIVGVPIGILVGLVLGRYFEGQLYGVKLYDPLAFLLVSGLMLFVSLVSVLGPAVNSAGTNPAVALKDE